MDEAKLELDWHSIIHHRVQLCDAFKADGDGYLLGGYTITVCDAGCPQKVSETRWNIRVTVE